MFLKHSLFGLAALFFANEAVAGIVYNEAMDGTFSRDNLSPTNLGTFTQGANLVSGRIEDAESLNDVDVFTFVIAPGTQLDSLVLSAYSSFNPLAFIALDDTTSFQIGRAHV